MTDSGVTAMCARLRAKVHKGRFMPGGGSIATDGMGTTVGSSWGGEKIMEYANPDGPAAADMIEALAMRKLDPALAIPNDEGIREALIKVRRMLPNVATLLDTIKVEWTQGQREALTSNMIAIDKALAATLSRMTR